MFFAITFVFFNKVMYLIKKPKQFKLFTHFLKNEGYSVFNHLLNVPQNFKQRPYNRLIFKGIQ
ncbi:hypothetical protein Cabys_3556 [Caldithrix abyssi DSM 13497]|uniref:Uncharacterized protein n=1 Tax=Caldithrix abyssi DSM 13497 TaxID=880073 RepID=A0A1J1CCN0_CALAY|nr:hypothetical protein Cabys_3556 [Caldithrix abyssi DSM 13497]